MLYAGLDLSRKRPDVSLLDSDGCLAAETAAPPDADGLRSLVERFRPLGLICAAMIYVALAVVRWQHRARRSAPCSRRSRSSFSCSL